jgi:iron complex transport system substrate-binding protein
MTSIRSQNAALQASLNLRGERGWDDVQPRLRNPPRFVKQRGFNFARYYQEVDILMRAVPLVTGIFIILSLLMTMTVGCSQQSLPATFTDDMGREVTIKGIPEQIVSHVPGITETLFALGLGEKVVGVSDYCDYPEEAKLKPSVGNYFNPSIENIVALDPDLVLTDGHSEGIKQLDSLGITYVVLEPKDIDGILKDFELLGKITGREKEANKLIKDMQERMSYVKARVEGAPRPKVFYIIDATDLNNPWTAGPGSFINSLITMAGGENIGAKAGSAWAKMSIEEVVNSDPDIIILPTKHGTAFTPPEALKGHPAWQKITAVKRGRIFTIDDDLVSRYGPRIILGLEEMAKIIHPELFK